MNTRDLVIDSLGRGHKFHLDGNNTFAVNQGSPEPSIVYCVEDNDRQPFDVPDLEAALIEAPSTQFLVVLGREVTSRTYGAAESAGVCIDSLAELRIALRASGDLSHHQNSGQAELRRSVLHHWSVKQVERCGRSTFRIHRDYDLSLKTAAFVDGYQLTTDEVYTTLEENYHLSSLDAMVATSPYVHGFAPETLVAAENAHVSLIHMNEFLTSLST